VSASRRGRNLVFFLAMEGAPAAICGRLLPNARASYDPSVMHPAARLVCTFAVVALGASAIGYVIHQAAGEPWGAITAFVTFVRRQ
jgi:hypothetical protein